MKQPYSEGIYVRKKKYNKNNVYDCNNYSLRTEEPNS